MNSIYLELADQLLKNKKNKLKPFRTLETTTISFSSDESEKQEKEFELEEGIFNPITKNAVSHENKILDHKKTNIKHYTCYSGCDAKININSFKIEDCNYFDYVKVNPILIKALINNSKYTDIKLLKEYPILLVFELNLLKNEHDLPEEFDFNVNFETEYGEQSKMSLKNVHVLSEFSGLDANSLGMSKTYICCAKQLEKLTEVI